MIMWDIKIMMLSKNTALCIKSVFHLVLENNQSWAQRIGMRNRWEIKWTVKGKSIVNFRIHMSSPKKLKPSHRQIQTEITYRKIFSKRKKKTIRPFHIHLWWYDVEQNMVDPEQSLMYCYGFFIWLFCSCNSSAKLSVTLTRIKHLWKWNFKKIYCVKNKSYVLLAFFLFSSSFCQS